MFLLYFIIFGIFRLVVLEEPALNNNCTDEKESEAGHAFDACLNKTVGAHDAWYHSKYGTKVKPFVPFIQEKCDFTSHIANCLEKRIDLLKDCSNLKSSLTKWQVEKKMDTEFFKHVCPNIDEFTRIFNKASTKCLEEGFKHTFWTCSQNITFNPEDILKLEEKCSDIKTVVTCFNTTITEYCPEEVREFSMRIANNVTNSVCPTTGK